MLPCSHGGLLLGGVLWGVCSWGCIPVCTEADIPREQNDRQTGVKT